MLLLDAGILGLCCKKCLNHIFNSFDNKAIIIVTWLPIITVLILTFLQFEKILKITTSVPFAICSYSLQALIPILAIIASIIKKKKNNHLRTITNTPLALPPPRKERAKC